MASVVNGIPQEVYLEELDTLTLSRVEIDSGRCASAGKDERSLGLGARMAPRRLRCGAKSAANAAAAAGLFAKERRAQKLPPRRPQEAAKAAKAAKKKAEAEAAGEGFPLRPRKGKHEFYNCQQRANTNQITRAPRATTYLPSTLLLLSGGRPATIRLDSKIRAFFL